MQIKIPFINTSIETDLTLTFLLMPLWWVTGFSIFIYHIAAGIVLFKILMRRDTPLKLPYAAAWFSAFSLFYLLSILINIGLRPAQRIFASLNNFSLIVLGLLLLIGVYNSNPAVFFRKFLKVCQQLCWITSVIGIVFFFLWWQGGHKHIEFPTILGAKMPGLMNFPYFYNLLLITNTMSSLFTSTEAPRLTIYSTVPTGTGGIMLVLIPMMMAYYALQRRKGIGYRIVLLLSITVLALSLSRSAIYGFVFAFIMMFVLERGGKTQAAFGYGIFALFASGLVQRGFEWMLNLRKSSTVGRFELYEQAFKILWEENPLMGIGVHIREGFTMMAIGSHAMYVEILFVSGLIGLPLFLIYQFLVMKNWYLQKNALTNRTSRVLWRYLGMSLIALNIWVLTDTLIGLPFTPYGYYLISGSILLLGNAIPQLPEHLFEDAPASASAGNVLT